MSTEPASYRIFVGAFLNGDLNERIQAIRMRWDPKTARITPPHVTLAGTYERRGVASPASEADTISRLCGLRQSVQPFELVLAGVRTFPPADPNDPMSPMVIYHRVEPTPGLIAVRKALVEMLGKDKHPHFIPHLTLAMRLSGEAARRALHTLAAGDLGTQRYTCNIQELRLMQRSEKDTAWRCIATFSLSHNGNTPPCDGAASRQQAEVGKPLPDSSNHQI